MLHNDANSWGTPAKFFHWLMAALIAAQITLGLLAVAWHMSPTKIELFFWHKSSGMLILLLLALRLIWRLTNPVPELPAETPAWERTAARMSHAIIYFLMGALPLSGWVVNSAANIPFHIFWTIPLPAIVAPDKAVAEVFAYLHRGLFVLLALMIVVHVAAALRHHFVKRNNLLVRMLPWRTP